MTHQPTGPVPDRITLTRDQLAALLAHHADVLAAGYRTEAAVCLPAYRDGLHAAADKAARHANRLTAAEESTVVAELLDGMLTTPGSETAAVAHSCRNCEGVDPDTCLMNPDRPADSRPRCTHCGLPHDLTPNMASVCASIRASIRDHHGAEAPQQPDPQTPSAPTAGPAPTELRIRVLREILARIDGSSGEDDSATEQVGAAQVRAVLAEILADMQPAAGPAGAADKEHAEARQDGVQQ